MELYPKRKTDEEYVEVTRRLIKRSKWFGLIFVIGGLLQVAMFMVLSHLIYSIDGVVAEVSDGVHIGIMFGAMGGVFLVMGVQCVISAVPCFMGRRTERLMIKFYDEMKMKEDASNQPSQPTAGKSGSG